MLQHLRLYITCHLQCTHVSLQTLKCHTTTKTFTTINTEICLLQVAYTLYVQARQTVSVGLVHNHAIIVITYSLLGLV